MRATWLLLCVGLLLVGCGATGAGADAGCTTAACLSADAGDGLAPDFALLDVNPASPTSGQQVSPRNFQGRVSAWYFGHSS